MRASAIAPLLIMLSACHTPPDTPATPPPAIDLIGGRPVRDQGRLTPEVIAGGTLRLRTDRPTRFTARWLAPEPTPLTVEPTRPAAAGFVTELHLPPTLPRGPGRIEVVADAAHTRTWATIAVDDRRRAPHRIAVRQAWKRDGDAAGARRLLDALHPRDRADRVWLEAERARIAWSTGQRDVAIDGMARAAGIAGAQRPSDAAEMIVYAAYYSTVAGHRDRAEAHATRALQIAEAAQDETRAIRARTILAQLERDRGRFRAAGRLLDAARDRASTLGDDAIVRDLDQRRATLLGRQGRHREALELAGRPTDRAGRINHAWRRMVAMQAGALDPDYPAIVQTYTDLLAITRPAWPRATRANAELNRAWAAWLAGDVSTAATALDAARAIDPERAGYYPDWARILDGQLALARHAPQIALDAFIDAGRRAARENRGPSIAGWQALWGEGRARLALGQTDAAIARWRAARDLGRTLAQHTALSTSRSAFLTDRRPLVVDLATLLLDRGQIAEAFAVVDDAAAPTLRAAAAASRVDALAPAALKGWDAKVAAWRTADRQARRLRDDLDTTPADRRPAAESAARRAERTARDQLDAAWAWLDARSPQPPADPLGGVPPDTALIAFTRLNDGWHAFLALDGQVQHRRVSPDDLVGPWRSTLIGRRAIYVVDGGLGAARALVEPGALPAPAALIPFAGWLGLSGHPPERSPVVVADPDGTLPGSRAAALAIARAAGIDPLVGAEATRDAVLAALDGAAWMHFDGHGVVIADDPWQSHLVLAGGARLALVDVLAARPRVGVVILGACDAGQRAELAGDEAIGLADGFLLAGASTVIAADRPLGVDEAARMVKALHRHGVVEHPARAWHAATDELKRAGDAAWIGWRLFGRID